MTIFKFYDSFAHVAECLINEDCPDTDYCDPNTRSCTDACNLNGEFAVGCWELPDIISASEGGGGHGKADILREVA